MSRKDAFHPLTLGRLAEPVELQIAACRIVKLSPVERRELDSGSRISETRDELDH